MSERFSQTRPCNSINLNRLTATWKFCFLVYRRLAVISALTGLVREHSPIKTTFHRRRNPVTLNDLNLSGFACACTLIAPIHAAIYSLCPQLFHNGSRSTWSPRWSRTWWLQQIQRVLSALRYSVFRLASFRLKRLSRLLREGFYMFD